MTIERDARIHQAEFTGKQKISDGFIELSFHVTGNFSFIPGQYVWIELPHGNVFDEQSERRAFSLATAPNDKGIITITARQDGESIYRKQLFSLKKNEAVRIHGPFGSAFCLPEDPLQPLVLLAGGTGVAPFLGLLRSLMREETKRVLHLHFFQENDQPSSLSSELKAIGIRHSDWDIRCIPHRATKEDLATSSFPNKSFYYISGPQGFVDEANAILLEQGVAPKYLRFEALYPTTPESEELLVLFQNGQVVEKGRVGSPEARAHQLLLQMIQNSTNHMVITNRHGQVVFANRAAQKITGYSLREMLGQTPRLWGGLMSPQFYQKLWESKFSGEPMRDIILNRRKNGELYSAMAHIEPLKNADGILIGFVATEEDVTLIEEKRLAAERAQQELQKKIEELERLNRLMINREIRMIELKERIQELESK